MYPMGLRPVMVCQSVSGTVQGVGSTKIQFIAEYPVGLCGIDTVVRFTILEDGPQRIPSLMSVDALRDWESEIKLSRKQGDSLVLQDESNNRYKEDLVQEKRDTSARV